MRLTGRFAARCAAVLIGISSLGIDLQPASGDQSTIHERMFHSCAVEAVVWAMPLLNFKGS